MRWDFEVSLATGRRALLSALPLVTDRVVSLAPLVEVRFVELVELTLGPKRAFRQLVLAAVVQCGIICWQVVRRRKRNKRDESLADAPSLEAWTRAAADLDRADGADRWCAEKGGCEEFVNSRALRAATQRLRKVLKAPGDVHAAMYTLRGGGLLARDAHGMASPRLHERARVHVPKVVDAYLQAALDAIDLVRDGIDENAPADARLAFFNECRHAHGRTALLLSGGAGLGAYHLGVVSALREASMLPRVISGASAGSIVAATVCCRRDDELGSMLRAIGVNDEDEAVDYHAGTSQADAVSGDPIFRLDFFRWRVSTTDEDRDQGEEEEIGDQDEVDESRIFDGEDEEDLLPPPPSNLASELMSGDHLAEVIRSNVGGDLTFQEAFDATGKILNIPVREHDSTGRHGRVKASAEPRLLNYLTAPHVVVWSAARASCAVPGVFMPSPLFVRDRDGQLRFEEDYHTSTSSSASSSSRADATRPKPATNKLNAAAARTVYVDGSMGADLPMETMRTLFNCNHFICSQTNVHAAVLGDSALRLVGARAPGVPATVVSASVQTYEAIHSILNFVKAQLKTWVRNGTALAVELVSAGERTYSSSFSRRRRRTFWERCVPWQYVGWFLAITTQPYEGRPQDVTIVPWAGHLSLLTGLFKTLDNPRRGDPIAKVVDAGRKNTWNELAKIKAHTAVEFALENAVHRLRLALFRLREEPSVAQAYASSRAREAAVTDAIGRTPSFYTSPSLLQLSGLAVVDPVLNIDQKRRPRSSSRSEQQPVSVPEEEQLLRGVDPQPTTRRTASADNVSVVGASPTARRPLTAEFVIKTSSMANFYYRGDKNRSKSHDRLAAGAIRPASRSETQLMMSEEMPPRRTSSNLLSRMIRTQSSGISDADPPSF